MTSGQAETEAEEGHGTQVLGIVADPDMPTQVGARLAKRLTDSLNERTGQEWSVQVVADPVTAAETDIDQILKATASYCAQREWGYAICLTDLPLLLQDRPLLADASIQRGVGLVSLPALGGLQPYRRMRQMLTQLLDDLLSQDGDPSRESHQHHMYSWLTDKLAPIHRLTSPGGDVDVRYTTSPFGGWLRLVSGMVRTNRPWQLIFGLSSALAAAIATSAFGLSSSTIWNLADRLSTLHQVLAALASVALLVGWLISAHELWERRKHAHTASSHRLRALYNTSTVLTLSIGVALLYVGLFAVNLGVASFLVTPSLLVSMVGHPATWSTYVSLAWGFTTMGVIAGALGSSMESDRAVRQAAYGYREEQRRAQHATSRSQ